MKVVSVNCGAITLDMITEAYQIAKVNFGIPTELWISPHQYDCLEAIYISEAIKEMYVFCTPIMAADLSILINGVLQYFSKEKK